MTPLPKRKSGGLIMNEIMYERARMVDHLYHAKRQGSSELMSVYQGAIESIDRILRNCYYAK
ncbi:MAG: hypothetical protein KJO69_05950 [Gammaproteobacteria bacterium]|nr:hypothetical protein [Gammaproteobacteria bacterium]